VHAVSGSAASASAGHGDAERREPNAHDVARVFAQPQRGLDLLDPLDPLDPADLLDLLDSAGIASVNPMSRVFAQPQRAPRAHCTSAKPTPTVGGTEGKTHALRSQRQRAPNPNHWQHRKQNPPPTPSALP
jgi:hypothetical protein